MLNKKLTINNKLGLHARAAAKFVNEAMRYGSEITVLHETQKANGKSIMDMMLLAAHKGTEVELIVKGEDEQEAIAALETLIKNRFGEKE